MSSLNNAKYYYSPLNNYDHRIWMKKKPSLTHILLEKPLKELMSEPSTYLKRKGLQLSGFDALEQLLEVSLDTVCLKNSIFLY